MINDISQFAIVTPNVDSTIKSLQNTLNLGPMKVWDFKYPSLFDIKINGQNADWSMKLAFGWIGNMQFEVIEPTGGDSLYQSFLESRGQAGIQHLLLDRNQSYESAKSFLNTAGYPIYNEAKSNVAVQLGPLKLPPLPMWLAKSSATTFGYTNTLDSMKVVWEISKYPPGVKPKQGIRMGVPTFWAGNDKSHFEKLPDDSIITSVGGFVVLVGELGQAKSRYDAVFAGSPQTEGPSSVTYQLATSKLTVAQPQPGSTYKKIVSKSKEGAHILQVTFRNNSLKSLKTNGFDILEDSDERLVIGHKDLPFYMEGVCDE